MNLSRGRWAGSVGVLLSAAACAVVLAPPASAAPADAYSVSSIPAGVTSGSEIAIDPSRRQLFVSDNDFFLTAEGATYGVNPHELDPKVSIVGIEAKRPVGAISYRGQPWGAMLIGPVPAVPSPQVPEGIDVDTLHHRVVTTNTHPNGITVADMNARTTGAANLISIPGSHPMGVRIDDDAQLAYVALTTKDAVAIINTATRRQVGEIPGIFHPSLLDIDTARHRLYVGNADYDHKKTNYVTVIDTRTRAIIKKIATPSNSRPTVDPTTGRVFAASYDTGEISVIDPDSLTVVRTIATGTTPNKLVIDATRRVAYTANLTKRSITVIDPDTYRVITTVPVGAVVHTLAIDPTTGTVYGSQFHGSQLTVLTPSS